MENSDGKEEKEGRGSFFGLRRSFSKKGSDAQSPLSASPASLSHNERRQSAPAMSTVDENASDAGTEATGSPKKKKSKIFSRKSLTKMFRSNSMSSTPGKDTDPPSHEVPDDESAVDDQDHLDESRMSEKSAGTLNDDTTPKKKRFSMKKAVSKMFRSNSLTSSGQPDVAKDANVPHLVGTPGSLRNEEGEDSAKSRRKSMFSFSSGSKKKSGTGNNPTSSEIDIKIESPAPQGVTYVGPPISPILSAPQFQGSAPESKRDVDQTDSEMKGGGRAGEPEEEEEEEEEVVKVDTSFKTKQSFFENLSNSSSKSPATPATVLAAQAKSQVRLQSNPVSPATPGGAAKILFASVDEDPTSPQKGEEVVTQPTSVAAADIAKSPKAEGAVTKVSTPSPVSGSKLSQSSVSSNPAPPGVSTTPAQLEATESGNVEESPPPPPSTPGSTAGDNSTKPKKSSFISAVKSITKKIRRASFSPTLVSPRSEPARQGDSPSSQVQVEQVEEEKQDDKILPPPSVDDEVCKSPSTPGETASTEHFKTIPSPTTVSPERYMYGVSAPAAYPIPKVDEVIAVQQAEAPKSPFMIDSTEPNAEDDPSVLRIHAPGKEESELAEMLIPNSLLHPVLVLILRNNSIFSPERFCFGQRFDKLTSLDLGYNNISGTIKGLPHTLQRLDLSHNRITNVSNVLNCLELVELNLSYNNIKIFHGLPPKLVRVDLSHNVISSIIPIRTLALSPGIKYIDLTGNSVIVDVREWKVVVRTTLTQLVELNGRLLPKPKRANIPAPPINGARTSPERIKSLAASREEQRVNDAVRTRMHQIKLNLRDESKKLVEDRLVSKPKTLRPDQASNLTKRLSVPTQALKQKKATPPVPPPLFSTRDLALRKSTQTITTISAPPPGRNVDNEITTWLNKTRIHLEKSSKMVTKVVKLSNQDFVDEDDIMSLSENLSRLELLPNRDAPLKVEHAIAHLSDGDVLKRRVATVREHVDIMCMLLQQIDSAVLLCAQGVFHLREAVDSALASGPGLVMHTTVLRAYDSTFDPSLLARRDFGSRSIQRSATGGLDTYRRSPTTGSPPSRLSHPSSTLRISPDTEGFAETKATEQTSELAKTKKSEPEATPESYMERLRSRATMRALFGSSNTLPSATDANKETSPARSPARRSLDFGTAIAADSSASVPAPVQVPRPPSLNFASASPQRTLISAKSAPALHSPMAATDVENQNTKAAALARVQAKFSRTGAARMREDPLPNVIREISSLETTEQDDLPPPPPPIASESIPLSSDAVEVIEVNSNHSAQDTYVEPNYTLVERETYETAQLDEMKAEEEYAPAPALLADEREVEDAAESYHIDGYSHYHNEQPDQYESKYDGHYESAYPDQSVDQDHDNNSISDIAGEIYNQSVDRWNSTSQQSAYPLLSENRHGEENAEGYLQHESEQVNSSGAVETYGAAEQFAHNSAYHHEDYCAAADTGGLDAYGGDYGTEYGTGYGEFRRGEDEVTEEEEDVQDNSQPTAAFSSQDLAFFTDADINAPGADFPSYYGSFVANGRDKGVAMDLLVPAEQPIPDQPVADEPIIPHFSPTEQATENPGAAIPEFFPGPTPIPELDLNTTTSLPVENSQPGNLSGGGDAGGTKLSAKERLLARLQKNKK